MTIKHSFSEGNGFLGLEISGGQVRGGVARLLRRSLKVANRFIRHCYEIRSPHGLGLTPEAVRLFEEPRAFGVVHCLLKLCCGLLAGLLALLQPRDACSKVILLCHEMRIVTARDLGRI
ncbi:hypothetical protein [Micromonospora sp. WMMD1274]|uniref:hypothetical protein n=1 Tax=Micromonospora sp. WMMD1274 TaxID=3404116 RepID=UPI003B95CA10